MHAAAQQRAGAQWGRAVGHTCGTPCRAASAQARPGSRSAPPFTDHCGATPASASATGPAPPAREARRRASTSAADDSSSASARSVSGCDSVKKGVAKEKLTFEA